MSTQLVVGVFTPSVLLAVARSTGRLEEHDLVVEDVRVPSSPAQFRALIDGEMQIGFTSPDNVLAYRFSPTNPLGVQADVNIVGTVDRGMGLALYGRPDLTRADQLRGAVLAVDVPTSGFALAMYALADSLGVRREEYRLEALGSTPNRLKALLAGECDATMLNAGNELLAEQGGCVRLASVADVCSPYVGTVLAVCGQQHLEDCRSLDRALRQTIVDIRAGRFHGEAERAAASMLGLPPQQAARYVERLSSPGEGLIPDDRVDVEGLRTVVSLRQRYLPEVVDGTDVLADALDSKSGLIAPAAPVAG